MAQASAFSDFILSFAKMVGSALNAENKSRAPLSSNPAVVFWAEPKKREEKKGASLLLLFAAAVPLMWEIMAGGPMG